MTRARRIDPSLLARTLDRAKATGPRGVVVFDLDSTLLDNRPRQAKILQEFGAAHHLEPLERAAPHHWDGWDIRRAMRNCGLEMAEVERWADQAKGFWRERFFTSAYCVLDVAIAGAPEFVRRVKETGAQVAYCTGRHEDMRAGSVECFVKEGFPVPGPGVHLLMKPTFDLHDDAWKERAYAHLHGLGEVLACFDNEPTHINGYGAAFPQAIMVHLATDDSGRPVDLLEGIGSVTSFVV